MRLIFVFIFCAAFITVTTAEKQSIKAFGNIQCCDYKLGFLEFCEAPKKAKIELWDHFKVLPNTQLDSFEIENSSKYQIEWEDDKILEIDPFLLIHVECSDRTIFDKRYDFTDTNPKTIEKDVRVEMKS